MILMIIGHFQWNYFHCQEGGIDKGYYDISSIDNLGDHILENGSISLSFQQSPENNKIINAILNCLNDLSKPTFRN